jgi:hypothetical protein
LRDGAHSEKALGTDGASSFLPVVAAILHVHRNPIFDDWKFNRKLPLFFLAAEVADKALNS